jgi:hypothetical protein
LDICDGSTVAAVGERAAEPAGRNGGVPVFGDLSKPGGAAGEEELGRSSMVGEQ